MSQNDDTISRKQAINAMWKIRSQQQMLDDAHKADLVMLGINLAERELEQLPSAQQDFDIDQKINKAYDDGYDQGYLQCKADKEPITGHWIERQKKGSSRWQSWCSVCGKHSGIGGIESNRHKPFCPNCGSPMNDEVEWET